MENRSYFRIRKCSEKEAVFRNVLEKAVRKEKNESLFQTRSNCAARVKETTAESQNGYSITDRKLV